MKEIPNEISTNFNTVKGRKKIIELYKETRSCYVGKNKDNETVILHIHKTGLKLETFQNNGHVRINYYDENGFPNGETFEGKWK